MSPAIAPAGHFREVFLEIFMVNDRINHMILGNLDPNAWRAKPPRRGVRTIAAMFTHMHNVRRKWVRLSAPHLKLPAPLDRTRCTQKQAPSPKALSVARRCSLKPSLLPTLASSSSVGTAGPGLGQAERPCLPT
jgi:uncharacterized damage-inducible protein DinB